MRRRAIISLSARRISLLYRPALPNTRTTITYYFRARLTKAISPRMLLHRLAADVSL